MIPASRRRLLGLYVVAAAMLVALGGRLWYLQVLDTTHYKQLAEVNQTRQIVVPAVRGMITDDTGAPLVRNQTSMVVSVDMMRLSQRTGDGGKTVLARLAPLLHLSDKALSEKVRLCTRGVPQPCWTGSPYQPVPVAEHVSDATALQIMEQPKVFIGITASPSGAWLRRGRHPWRKRLHLPGGRPPVPPGARAMAKGAVVPRARGPRLFGMLGGRR